MTIEAGRLGAIAIRGAVVPTERNEPQIHAPGIGPDAAGDLETVESSKADVDKTQIRPRPQDQVDPALTIPSGVDHVAFELEQRAQGVARRGIIIEKDDALDGWLHGPIVTLGS